MQPTSFLKSAADYCRQLTSSSKSNFYYAFLFLPKKRREALEAVYAFCRLVDDVVDECETVEEKRAGIAMWRAEVKALYEGGQLQHPVSQKLRDALVDFQLRREDLDGIIDGCEQDISKRRYDSWEELRAYCYRVASCVGLLCIEIFGYSSPKAKDYAVDLGLALQLTNIIRDVREDAARDRIYLPLEDLAAFGVRERDILDGKRSPELGRLLRYEAQRARSHYLRARAAIGRSERRQLVIAEIMGDIYYRILEQLERIDYDVFTLRAKVPNHQKMAIAFGRFVDAKLFA